MNRLRCYQLLSCNSSAGDWAMCYVIVFKCLRFLPFSLSTLMRFQIDPFSKPVFKALCFQKAPFPNVSVFNRISVDGRWNRILMYALPYENALVWTLPKFASQSLERSFTQPLLNKLPVLKQPLAIPIQFMWLLSLTSVAWTRILKLETISC